MSKTANPFGDLTQILEQFKVPGVDMSALVNAHRKDFESLMAVNQAASEAMQSVARKQAEMLSQSMVAIQAAASNAGTGAGKLGDPMKQAELQRQAFEKALEGLKDLAEMTRQAQADALNKLSKRAAERLDELVKVMRPK